MTSSIDSNPGGRPITYVSAIIGGDRIAPEYWSSYFGLAPTVFVEKGKHFITPIGRPSHSPGRINVWGYSTKSIINSHLVAPHLEHLISKLGLPRPDLKSLIEANDLRFFVSCYWWNPAGDRIPVVDSELDAVIRQSGGKVFIDEYPCDIHIVEDS